MLLSFKEVLNIARHGVRLRLPEESQEDKWLLGQEQLDSLLGRGVDHLVADYRMAETSEKRRYLGKFLKAFLPSEVSASYMERDVRLATVDDFRDAGMVQRIFDGSDDVVQFLAQRFPIFL